MGFFWRNHGMKRQEKCTTTQVLKCKKKKMNLREMMSWYGWVHELNRNAKKIRMNILIFKDAWSTHNARYNENRSLEREEIMMSLWSKVLTEWVNEWKNGKAHGGVRIELESTITRKFKTKLIRIDNKENGVIRQRALQQHKQKHGSWKTT